MSDLFRKDHVYLTLSSPLARFSICILAIFLVFEDRTRLTASKVCSLPETEVPPYLFENGVRPPFPSSPTPSKQITRPLKDRRKPMDSPDWREIARRGKDGAARVFRLRNSAKSRISLTSPILPNTQKSLVPPQMICAKMELDVPTRLHISPLIVEPFDQALHRRDPDALAT